MERPADDARSAIREALARDAYRRDHVRVAHDDVAGFDWLVATHRGLFAVAEGRVQLLVHGWYWGIARHDGHLYLFENCGHRDETSNLGRIIRFDLDGSRLGAPFILVRGLHSKCHQIAIINDLICVVDTANQAIRRFALDGRAVDSPRPFPPAAPTDRSGAYLHINAIAKVGDRIGIVLHHGKTLPERSSEVAWLDADWRVTERAILPGHGCHDIVADAQGRTWHALSREGEIFRSDGLRLKVTDDRMSRGIALRPDSIAVGISTFGPRHLRGTLNGSLVVLERARLTRVYSAALPAAPTDVIAL